MGLTASEDSYTLAIFLNCSNIHYLLSVIYGSHFSTFSHILHKMVYKYQILIKMPEVKKSTQNAQGLHNFYIFLPLLLIQLLGFEVV
jgi:hypothetical protein